MKVALALSSLMVLSYAYVNEYGPCQNTQAVSHCEAILWLLQHLHCTASVLMCRALPPHDVRIAFLATSSV
jgi:hypothetical protein